MIRHLFDSRLFCQEPLVFCFSGGTSTPIHEIVSSLVLKNVNNRECTVGTIPQTKDIFAHLIYTQDYEETVRRVLSMENPKIVMKEVLEAISSFCIDPMMVEHVIRTFLYMCPDFFRDDNNPYEILNGSMDPVVKKKVEEHVARAKIRDQILEKKGFEAPLQVKQSEHWTVCPRNRGCFRIITQKDEFLVFHQGKRFALEGSALLGENPKGLMTFEELLERLNLLIENIQYI